MNIFVRSLLSEVAKNGKLLIAYLLTQAPWLSDYPGLADAVHAAMADPSKQNLINVLIQLIAVVGAGHRLLKILAAVF